MLFNFFYENFNKTYINIKQKHCKAIEPLLLMDFPDILLKEDGVTGGGHGDGGRDRSSDQGGHLEGLEP